jgi:hypothetical protein
VIYLYYIEAIGPLEILNKSRVVIFEMFPVQLRLCLTERNDFRDGGVSVKIQEEVCHEGTHWQLLPCAAMLHER